MWWQCNTLSRLYCTSSWLTAMTKGLDMLWFYQCRLYIMGCKQMGLVTFRWFSSFVVEVQYTLPGILHTAHGKIYIELFISFRWCLWLNRTSSMLTERKGVRTAYRQWGKGKKKSPAGQDSNLHFPHYPKVTLTSHYMLCHKALYQLHHPDWR